MSFLVSTIIPVYNRATFLEEAVHSVLEQRYRPIEVILVDDGSTDGTSRKVDALAMEHPDFVRSIHQENVGPGMAREAGRLVAMGEFIQYLDSDDLLLPGKFADQTGVLRENPKCGIAYGYTQLIDEKGRVLEDVYKETGKDLPKLFPRLLNLRWWNTQTPLFRRSVCDAIGPWQQMSMGEDWYYDACAGARNVGLVNCHTYVAQTRRHSEDRLTSGGLNREKLRDIARLIPFLHESAIKAGVPEDDPEWQQFFRWTFLELRRTAAKGLWEESQALAEVLKNCPCKKLKSKLSLYQTLRRIVGPRMSGIIFDKVADVKAGRG